MRIRCCIACGADLRSGNPTQLCSVCNHRYIIYVAQYVPGGKKFTVEQYAEVYKKLGQELVKRLNADDHNELVEPGIEPVEPVHKRVIHYHRKSLGDLDLGA
jgi:hypothetical protein